MKYMTSDKVQDGGLAEVRSLWVLFVVGIWLEKPWAGKVLHEFKDEE